MKLQVLILVAIQWMICAAQQEEDITSSRQKRAREAYLFSNNGAMEHVRYNRRIKVAKDLFDEMSMSMSMSMSMPPMMSKKGKGGKGKGAPPPPKDPKDPKRHE
jgi:hypothetical protein